MKCIDAQQLERLPGRLIKAGDTFRFSCHAGLACFNHCCRNLNLFLYPYDLLRLRRRIGIGSDAFIDRHVDVVMRPGHYFPEVLLRMADTPERTCPFLSAEGCAVYPDRPDTCRSFPVESGELHDAQRNCKTPVHFFRPPEFCLGQHADHAWTIEAWQKDQDARTYHQMTRRWAEVRLLFEEDPWGPEGFESPKGRMAFMAAYNLDCFRDFVFNSSFLKRYRLKAELIRKLRADDTALLTFGFEWIRVFVWGRPSPQIRPR
jgi:uncharacterized protein